MMPWKYFDYDLCIYMDGRYDVVGNLEELIKTRTDGWYCRDHYDAPGMYGEIKKSKTKSRRYLTPEVLKHVEKQREAYLEEGIPNGLPSYPTNGVIIRRNNAYNRAIGRAWWKEYYSWKTWNDQVDLWAVLWRNNWSVTADSWNTWAKYFKLRRHHQWAYL